MNLLRGQGARTGQAKIGNYLVPVDPARLSKIDCSAPTSPSAYGRSPGGSSRPTRAGCRSTSRWSRSSAPTSFVYGTCDVEGTPGNVIVRVSGRATGPQGRHDLRHHRPQGRPRLRHRDRRAPVRLNTPANFDPTPVPTLAALAASQSARARGRIAGRARSAREPTSPAGGRREHESVRRSAPELPSRPNGPAGDVLTRRLDGLGVCRGADSASWRASVRRMPSAKVS